MKRLILLIAAGILLAAGCQTLPPVENPRPVAPHAGEDMRAPNGHYHPPLETFEDFVPRGTLR